MIENKRFYYNTFYHKDDMSRVLEYEIIDRQSYPNYPDYDEEDVPDWVICIGENDSGWQDMLINLLNQLNDENEKVKSEYKVLHSQYQDLKNFVENNFNEYLTREKLNRQIAELSNENEQLKIENKEFKSNIIDFIDKKIDKLNNTDKVSIIPRESVEILKELKKELKK